MEGRVFENFSKKSKKFQNSKNAKKFQKPFPKVSKRVLNMFWGNFFGRKFLPSVPWRVESSKIFKKIKKFSKFQKSSKSFPKVSKRVLNMFCGLFFRKKFLPSVPWRVESSKIFKKKIKKFSKFQKCPKSFPKVSKRVLNMFWGDFFEKIFCPVFHGGSSLRKFFKKSKKNAQNFKIPKMLQNRSQKCPNVF